jgi:DNA-directed RNA polymerase omega subunit
MASSFTTFDKAIDYVGGNKYKFTSLVAKRARLIMIGAQQFVDKTNKPVVTAIREISERKISVEDILGMSEGRVERFNAKKASTGTENAQSNMYQDVAEVDDVDD